MIYLKFGFNIVLFMFVIGRMLCPHLVVFTVVRMFILIECSSLIKGGLLLEEFNRFSYFNQALWFYDKLVFKQRFTWKWRKIF